MEYANNKVSDLVVTYIGGGSRGWAWTFMNDLSMEANLSGTIRLYDINKEAAEHNKTIGDALTASADRVGKWEYEVSGSLQEALTGTDFVIISILPGTFDEMQSDVHLPERHGIYQSVGDTAGPGGLVRALRTIPMFREIAQAIKAYSPDAWVINYTNPMSLCVKTLYEEFPQIKAFGCCHEVFGTQKLLRDVVMAQTGLKDIDRSEIFVNVLGVNHFTWFDKASYKGMDLFPVYNAFIDANYEQGYRDPDENWANASFACCHRVKFDLFRRFGLIAAAGDRHLAEFMPGNTYLKDPETVESWKFGLTTVEWRKQDLQNRLARSARLVAGEEKMDAKPSGEEGILLIKALCGLERVISNVNVPNTAGQIANLPRETVVETNAVFSRDSIQPVCAGSAPLQLKALLAPHVENQELILRAAYTCDFALAYQAFMNDPLVAGRITMEEGEKLLKDMLANTAAYLPEGWKK